MKDTDQTIDSSKDESAYHITITQVDSAGPSHENHIQEAIVATLRRHHTTRATLSVALVGDERMAELNQTHLQHEGPTDVLAFDLRDQAVRTMELNPFHDDKEVSLTSGSDFVEGEIILSTQTAFREAQQRGLSIEAELALYAVHGTLHLLGYRDHVEHEAARMHAMEDEILTSIGLGPVYRCEEE